LSLGTRAHFRSGLGIRSAARSRLQICKSFNANHMESIASPPPSPPSPPRTAEPTTLPQLASSPTYRPSPTRWGRGHSEPGNRGDATAGGEGGGGAACDGEVIGCLTMLTRTYTTGRRQHYSRRSRTSSHKHIHYTALEIEHSTQHIRRNVARKVRQSRIWIIKVLKPTKLMCQMCLQSHTQTHLNQTTKHRFRISVRAA
jgi:hypothetical protein